MFGKIRDTSDRWPFRQNRGKRFRNRDMKFFGLKRGKNTSSTTISSQESAKGLSMLNVQQVVQHFPIGFRMQYFPEYLKDKKIDTIIAAYVVNDYVIYSNKDIQVVEQEDGQQGLEMHQNGEAILLDRIHGFQILIPQIERKEIDFRVNVRQKKEGTMDSMEKKANDFLRGNSITLFYRNPTLKGMLQLDTEVAKKVVFQTGPYAKRRLVMLQPLLDSFECVDLRRFSRIDTQIPVQIYNEGTTKQEGVAGFIQDFSERFVRVEIGEEKKHLLGTVGGGDKIVLKVILGDQEPELVLRGSIFRKRKNNIIISLRNVMKDGEFQLIDGLDEIYIKSVMLDHPNTGGPQNI